MVRLNGDTESSLCELLASVHVCFTFCVLAPRGSRFCVCLCVCVSSTTFMLTWEP